MSCATSIRRPHAIRICRLPRVIRHFRLRRDENGKNRGVVTRQVEVLQIQSVVPRLVVVGETELTLAALELNGKDGWPRNQHGVDSAPESWDVELQEDRAGKSTQSAGENIDLLFPRLALVDVEIMSVRRSQDPEDLMSIRIEKTVDRGRIIGGGASGGPVTCEG